MSRKHILLASAAAALIMPSMAYAQTEESTGANEEADKNVIVVTARLREENVQDVPVSITNLSEEFLERAEITDLQDLAQFTPGLVSSSPFGRINASPSIRGIVNAGLGEEQPVAFFLDGVYISGRSALNGTYFGLERVEVARGPQSALYGRNAFAGAVNYITKRPGRELEGKIEATVGTKDDYRGKVELSGPISDTLSVGVGALYQDYGGFFTNSVPGGPAVGSNKTFATLGSILWEATPDLKIYLKALYTDEKDGAPPHFLAPANSQPDSRSGFPRYFTGRLPTSGAGFFTNPEHQGVERESLRLSANVDLKIGDNMILQSVTGYNKEDGFYDFDADYTELFFNRTFEEFDKYDISQDLRLSGDSESLNWLIGTSYYYFNDDLLARNYLPGFGQSLPVGALTEQTTKTFSVYGALEVKPTEDLSIRGELRWQSEKKAYQSQVLDESGVPLNLQDSWKEFLPRGTITYTPGGGETLLYASVARGFKAGGFNTFANLFDNERTYEPEDNWTYEIGAKAQPFDGATINAALFWIDWDNQQVIGLSNRAPSSNQFTANAAASRSRGLELEASYSSPGGFDFSVGYAYTDAKFRDFVDPDLTFIPISADVSGNQVNRTSKHQLTSTVQYQAPINDTFDWFARADFAYQSSQFSVPANLARTGGITNVNARIGVEGENINFSIWAKNLFDNDTPYVGVRWFDASGRYTQLPPFQRAWLVTAREGARFGATLTYKFGN